MCKIRKCPFCGNDDARRIHRNNLLKIVPLSKLYRCHDCYAHYLVVAEKVKIVTNKGYSRIFKSLNSNDNKLEIRAASRNWI